MAAATEALEEWQTGWERLDIQYEKILARFSVGWKTKSAGLHDGGGSWALIEDRVERQWMEGSHLY